LGRALARAFAARDLNVMLAARNEKELRAITRQLEPAHPGQIGYCVTDMRDPAAIHAIFDAAHARFGMVDVLINNAGVQIWKPLEEWSDQEIIDTISVNLTGLILATRIALDDMLPARRGLILNIGSDVSRRYLANMAPYAASKFGVLGFSGSLLRQVRERGIKVCAILPGVIDTRLYGAAPKPERVAMKPAVVAEMLADFLDHPEHLVVDELTLHPMQQQF
jgi:short-subunit dehydrogenase